MAIFTIRDTKGFEYVVETKPNGSVKSILSAQLYASSEVTTATSPDREANNA